MLTILNTGSWIFGKKIITKKDAHNIEYRELDIWKKVITKKDAHNIEYRELDIWIKIIQL